MNNKKNVVFKNQHFALFHITTTAAAETKEALVAINNCCRQKMSSSTTTKSNKAHQKALSLLLHKINKFSPSSHQPKMTNAAAGGNGNKRC